MRRRVLVAAALVGVTAFVLYRTTLLPGLDLGDTASFQATVGSPFVSPRDGYPLYFAIGNVFLWITRDEPAHALNLASAVEGAIACALIVVVSTTLSGSIAAAVAAALLFAVSYTFWSQSIIAEVYALHVLLITLTIWLVLRWDDRPTTGRLTLFFAIYALAFGNHLSMILLAPGLALFLLTASPGGWRQMLTWRVIALAALCASLGALQYGWNLWTLWLLPNSPHSVVDALQQFWFDVTKTDWRETMVMGVPAGVLHNRAAMYAFDIEQQFGWIGPLLAVAGLAQLARTSWRRAALVFALYLANMAFAFQYNVGDTHVFYLPSHLLIAVLVAPGLVLFGSLLRQRDLAAVLLIAYVATRAWRDYPALDRSRDHRPTKVLADLTAGLDDRRVIFLTDLNWQLENGLTYFARRDQPAVAYTRMPAAALYAPRLVASNAAIGRDVVLTEMANGALSDAYGPLFRTERDPLVSAPSLAAGTANLPAGTRYVVCILKPTRELTLDWNDIGRTLAAMTGGRAGRVPDGDYVAIAGVQGQKPMFVVGADKPFRRSLLLDGVPIDIRMESWLAADTIRRMGFGHVVAARHHTLIVERGVSVVAFDRDGMPILTAYASNIFAPQPRYLVRR